MAAGLVSLTILDGTGASRTVQVWSTTGLLSGVLSFLQTIAGADGANPVSGANPLPVETQQYLATNLGYVQQAGITTATALASIPAGAVYVEVIVEGADCRWRSDGAAPTASVGQPLYAGSSKIFALSGSLGAVQIIPQAGGTSTINATYYK